MASKPQDKRKSKRIMYLCDVECEGEGATRFHTRINDLSATGAFLDSMNCFPVGSLLKLKFRVRSREIKVTAEVRHCMPRIGMGVRFVDLNPRDRAAIEALIEGKPEPVDPPAQPTQLHTLTPSVRPSGQLPQRILAGSFADVNLMDVVQIIENNKMTGALLIALPDQKGGIYFNEGQIVGARAGSDTGLEALKKFIDVTEGTFEFKKTTLGFQRTIQATSNTGLILDLLRTKDEERADDIDFILNRLDQIRF
jgi:hypothetical protein